MPNNQEWLAEEMVHCCLQFQRDRSSSWWGGRAPGSRSGGKSRKRGDQEAERVNSKGGDVLNAPGIPPVIYFL